MQPRPTEYDRLHPGPQEGLGDSLAFQRRRTPDAELPIDDGRVVEEQALGPARRTVVIHQRDRAARQPFGQLFGIGDCRGAADDDRVAVVKGADAPEAAQHVREVAAEDAAVGVQLVDHDVAQVGEQFDPARVVWQHAGVQHVRVGDDDVAGLSNRLPGADRRVAVVGVGFEVDLQGADQAMQFGELILRQCLGRKQIERPRLVVTEHRLQDRQVVAGGLARRRRGHDDDVLAGEGQGRGFGLVGVEPADAAGRQRLPQARVQSAGEAGVAGWAGRYGVVEG